MSALNCYESRGLIQSQCSGGNQRRYHKTRLRRVAFIRAAQQLGLGLGLAEIGEALASLPQQRTPTQADWARLSATWRSHPHARIAALQTLRDRLEGCIDCGCLSLKACALYNPQDVCAEQGAGAQRLPQLAAIENRFAPEG